MNDAISSTTPPVLSIIIPAYNEETLLPRCLDSVRHAVNEVTITYPDAVGTEVIVTDNNSTDRTSEIALQHGARVVFEPVNQIARARNAGATLAQGQWLLFIDADSRLHPATLLELWQQMAAGACGAGGCRVALEDAPLVARMFVGLWDVLSRIMRWAAGSFLFCRSEAFRDVGGFDEQYFAAEELYFSQALKKWCRERQLRFIILRNQPHYSSARKFHLYGPLETMSFLLRSIFRFRKTVRDPQALNYYYDGRR